MGIHERKEREKGHRRDEILAAAQKVFFERGLQSSTMDDIAEAAELSKGTLYLYHKSKEDLYLGVMMRGFDILHDMFKEALDKAPSTFEALRLLGTTYFEFFQKHRNYFRMFHFSQNPSLHKQVSQEMQEACNNQTQRIWGLVIQVLRRGIDEGVLKKDLNPIETAVILWSSSHAILHRIDNESEHWKETLDVDLVHVLSKSNSLLLEAIMTEKAKEKYGRLLENSSFPQFQEV